MDLNGEQLEGDIQHRAREFRLSDGKATLLRNHKTVTELRLDGDRVSVKPQNLDEERYQSKNGAATLEGEESHYTISTEESNDNEMYNVPDTKDSNEDEAYNTEYIEDNEGETYDTPDAEGSNEDEEYADARKSTNTKGMTR